MNSVGLRTEQHGGNVYIEDSSEDPLLSQDLSQLFGYMLEPYEKTIKVVWDINKFIKPILVLLPDDMAKKLMQGERIVYKGFRVWLGQTRHGHILGVSYKEHTHIKGNIYQRKLYDESIFELKQYYLGKPEPKDIYELRDAGDYILSVLGRMGLTPKRLTSASAIYQECVLDKMPIPTVWNMPEVSYPMMEMCANYVKEWYGDFESGNWGRQSLYKYDLSAAYPWALSMLPNLKYAKYVPFGGPEENAYWGILKGKLKIETLVSPIVDEYGNNKVGEFEDAVISSDDWQCIERWGLGRFEPISGWFIKLTKNVRIFDYIMHRLFEFRGGNPTRDALAKAMAVSVWGKFLETHGEDLGDYFNGIYACMTTSKVRSRVCNFIYENKLQDDVVEVTVDGFKSRKQVLIGKQRRFGEWRLS